MEARIAKLEAHVDHIMEDCGDIKSDIRGFRTTLDAIKDSISSAKIWALTLYIALAAVLLGVMARGFKWI